VIYPFLFSLKCPVVAHWGCLASTQREEILRAVLQRDTAAWTVQPIENADGDAEGITDVPKKRLGLEPHQTTEFVCGSCSKASVCIGCLKSVAGADIVQPLVGAGGPDVEMVDGTDGALADGSDSVSQLLFRCSTCKRPAHYAHLPQEGGDIVSTALYYQSTAAWQCADCFSFDYDLDKILAWRPYPPDAVEPALQDNDGPDYMASLPREYLVKWDDRGYKRAQVRSSSSIEPSSRQ